MKVICIDARLWGVRHTGIGRYIENLVANLPDDPNVKIVVIVPEDLAHESKLLKFQKYYSKFHPYTFRSFIEMHWLLFKIKPDLVHIPHLTVPFFWPGKIIVTVHDLIKHYSKGTSSSTHGSLVYGIKYVEYLIMSTLSIYRASHIIVPSKFWKDELMRNYGLSNNKITVTYEGVFND